MRLLNVMSCRCMICNTIYQVQSSTRSTQENLSGYILFHHTLEPVCLSIISVTMLVLQDPEQAHGSQHDQSGVIVLLLFS